MNELAVSQQRKSSLVLEPAFLYSDAQALRGEEDFEEPASPSEYSSSANDEFLLLAEDDAGGPEDTAEDIKGNKDAFYSQIGEDQLQLEVNQVFNDYHMHSLAETIRTREDCLRGRGKQNGSLSSP